MPELNRWDMADFLTKHALNDAERTCVCRGSSYHPRWTQEDVWREHASHQAVALYHYLTGQ